MQVSESNPIYFNPNDASQEANTLGKKVTFQAPGDFSRLPIEIVNQILSQIEAKDLIPALAVSTEFRDLILSLHQKEIEELKVPYHKALQYLEIFRQNEKSIDFGELSCLNQFSISFFLNSGNLVGFSGSGIRGIFCKEDDNNSYTLYPYQSREARVITPNLDQFDLNWKMSAQLKGKKRAYPPLEWKN